ncbi:hypothetical protein BaRGS_00013978 [Batillaria attramentaria]|uniref:Uncharacterized protein n=1 Tax=Batillaria attramentaria TaxID=370345 RepID=A0ABD0L6E6_9CAEN
MVIMTSYCSRLGASIVPKLCNFLSSLVSRWTVEIATCGQREDFEHRWRCLSSRGSSLVQPDRSRQLCRRLKQRNLKPACFKVMENPNLSRLRDCGILQRLFVCFF